jgi:hypothetical protein
MVKLKLIFSEVSRRKGWFFVSVILRLTETKNQPSFIQMQKKECEKCYEKMLSPTPRRLFQLIFVFSDFFSIPFEKKKMRKIK